MTVRASDLGSFYSLLSISAVMSGTPRVSLQVTGQTPHRSIKAAAVEAAGRYSSLS